MDKMKIIKILEEGIIKYKDLFSNNINFNQKI